MFVCISDFSKLSQQLKKNKMNVSSRDALQWKLWKLAAMQEEINHVRLAYRALKSCFSFWHTWYDTMQCNYGDIN